MHSPTERIKFWQLLLDNLGVGPLTPWRKAFLDEWARYENTEARHNPLATTRPGLEWAENPYFNKNDGFPVRNYESIEAGALKTAETLGLAFYTKTLKTIKDEMYVPGAGEEIKNTWGTFYFGQALMNGWRPSVSSPEPFPATGYIDPVFTILPVEGTITGRYWQTTGYWSANNPHAGLDIGGPPFPIFRKPVLAPAPGIIDGVFPARASGLHSSFGNFVIEDFPKTKYFGGFAHLDSIAVVAGQSVNTGDILGYVGYTGLVDPPNENGAHLHFQLSTRREFPKEFEATEDPLKFYKPGQVTTPPIPAKPTSLSDRLALLERIIGGWGIKVTCTQVNQNVLQNIKNGPVFQGSVVELSGPGALRYIDDMQISIYNSHQNLNSAVMLMKEAIGVGQNDTISRQEILDLLQLAQERLQQNG